MKRKSPENDFLTTLQTSRPSADTAFVQKLKQKLLTEAQEILPEPRVSGLAFIFQSMKRYSLAYVGALVLVAFGTLLLLPNGLDPQEFLAKASEQYEVQSGIFHEERLNQHFENNAVVEASLEDWWSDEKGNTLWVVRNPDTKEVVQVDLTVVNENGDSSNYLSPSMMEGMGTNEWDTWDETYAGDKYICAEIETVDDTIYKAYLKVAKEDFSVYTVEGESESTEQEEMTPEQELLNGDNSANAVRELLETIASGNSERSNAYKEGTYFVFEREANAQDGDGIYEQRAYSYFSLETYKLEKQKLTFGDEPNRYDLTTYLAHEYLAADQAAEIFDPSKYDVQLSPVMTVGSTLIQESGCYYQGKKLSEEEKTNLLESLPDSALKDWEELMNSMQEPQDPTEIFPDETFIEEEIIPNDELPEASWIKPTEGTITQGFHAGHYGYDIANRAKPDIVAVASGTVVYASSGIWDGGYGDNIWIDHGNGYKTHYANMEEITVKEGDTVTQGQVIGKMGNTGRVYGVTGIHLHFELTYNDIKVSPSIMNVW